MVFEVQGEPPRLVKAGQPMLVFLEDDELGQSGWVRRSPG